MAQLVVRVDDKLVAEVDRLIELGVFASRSEAVRTGLADLLEHRRRRRVGAEIVDAYRRQPQSEDERVGLEEATRALIAEEPW